MLNKEIKSPTSKLVLIVMLVILMLITFGIYTYFGTDLVVSVDKDTVTKEVVANEHTANTVQTKIQEQATSDSNVVIPGVSYVSTGAWYKSLTAEQSKVGKVVTTLSLSTGSVNLYSGLPWEATPTTYEFDATTASNDVINYLNTESGTDSGLSTKSIFVYEFSSGKKGVSTVDGVQSLLIAYTPSMVDKDYCDGFTKSKWTTASTADSSLYNVKVALVLQDKTTGDIVYCPASKGDAKAHTFPGGVLQTEVKLMSNLGNGSYGVKYGDTGGSGTTTIKGLVSDLHTRKPEAKSSATIADYVRLNTELYCANRSDLALFNNYTLVAYIVWGT